MIPSTGRMAERTDCTTEPEAPSVSFQSEQCLFVYRCACTLFCISSEAEFPTDWRRQGFFNMLAMITVPQSCWLINSAGPTASSSRVWRMVTSQGYELRFHAFIPLFLPSADGHSLSFPFHPPSSSLQDSWKQGNPGGGTASAVPGSPRREADAF